MPHPAFRRVVGPDPNNGIRGDKVRPSLFNDIYEALENTPTLDDLQSPVNLQGVLTSTGDLPDDGNTLGDAYLVNGTIWVWSGTAWTNQGSLTQGPEGDPALLNLKGTVALEANLPASGNVVNDVWVVEADGHGWAWTAGHEWVDIGTIQGPQGDPGTPGGYDADEIVDADTTGVTSAATAFHTAMSAATTGGAGVVGAPSGTYNAGSGIVLRTGKLTLRGAGRESTELITPSALGAMIESSASFPITRLSIEDFGLDMTNVTDKGIVLYGEQIADVELHRLRFTGMAASTTAIALAQMDRVVIDGCLFDGSASPALGKGVGIFEGGGDVTIRNSSFLWLRDGIVADSGPGSTDYEEVLDRLVVESCTFDGFWWLLPSVFSGSGGTVTYTSTVLTDSGASFSGLTAGTTHNVRAMPVRESGTVTSANGKKLTDSSATFVTNLVKPGEIVRSGTKWAIVSHVRSETELRVERWMGTTTNGWVVPPAAAAAYTIYGIYLGEVTSNTGTTITTPRWWDLDGTTVTPAAGTRYEVMRAHGNYHLHTEYGVRDTRVLGNTFRRGWSDQVSLYSPDVQVIGNLIEWGQDLGIARQRDLDDHTGRGIIANNRIRHQGATGIYCYEVDGDTIEGNIITASQWENFVETQALGGIVIDASTNCRLIGNNVDGEDLPLAYAGYVVKGASTDTWMIGNRGANHQTTDLLIVGASVSGLHVRDFDGAMSHVSSAVGHDYAIVGSGSPETVHTAGVGSSYRDLSGGAVYHKATGTGATGWVNTTTGDAASSPLGDYVALIEGHAAIQSYWKLDESSGTSIADSVGAVTGTLTGSATLGATGLPVGGTAIDFTGGYIDLGDNHDLTGTAAFSIEGWYNGDVVTGWQAMIGKRWSGTGWLLEITDPGQPNLIRISTGGTSVECKSPTTISATSWHHVVGTFDGTNSKIYVDGVLKNTVNSSSISIAGNAGDLVISGEGVSMVAVNGRMAHIAIYNDDLDLSTIQAHYDAGVGA